MRMTDEQLRERVEAKFENVYMTTKSEVVAYYREQYGSDTSKWATQAAKDVYEANPGLYKTVKNARRNFEGERENTPSSKSAKGKSMWANVGKSLPPIGKKPPSAVTITASGSLILYEPRKDRKGRIRGNGWAKMSHATVTLTGTDAVNPTWDVFFDQYFTNFEGNPVHDYDIVGLDVQVVD